MKPDRPLLFRSTFTKGTVWEITDVYWNGDCVRFNYKDHSGREQAHSSSVPVEYLLKDLRANKVEWME